MTSLYSDVDRAIDVGSIGSGFPEALCGRGRSARTPRGDAHRTPALVTVGSTPFETVLTRASLGGD